MNNIYDFIVIGAGISACTFASCLNKRFSDASILLVEHGRRLGGRATTRRSRKNTILEYDHGLPSISFSKHISQDILTLISPLIDSKKLLEISDEILLIDQFGILNNAFITEKVFRCVPFMTNFCEGIINQSINPKKIDFLFQVLIKKINRINNIWEIEVDKGRFIQSKNLILSSSLIVHPRCFQILKTNTLPLREALILGEDKVVDSVLKETKKLNYIQRKTYILYVTDYAVVENFSYNYLQIFFSNIIRESCNFEKIIFQRQFDGSMIIVLHCYCTHHLIEVDFEKIINFLTTYFCKYQIFIDLFLQARMIDTMYWRASQPLNNLLSKELQWSSTSNIGFCGDWFNLNSPRAVESAMNSSIRLAKLLTSN